MVVHNPNNWHWVDKNCLPWAVEYLNDNVKGISYEKDSTKLVVSLVDLVTGDCDVTQRKGKVLCIYDMVVSLAVSGTVDESEVSGKIKLEEFVHDQDEDEYQFSVTGDAVSDIKKALLPLVLVQLQKFQGDLIATNEQDVQHGA